MEELTKPDSFIETELQRFEKIITKEQLIAMADSVKDLVIKDTEDKAGLKAVIEGRKQLKFQRVQIQKEAKNIRESAVRFQKAVIAKEKEFVDLLEPVENILAHREEEYYSERERIRLEEEKRESDRIQAMIDQLSAVRHAVDFHELKALTEVQFQNILAEATIKYNADLKAEKEERQRQYELRLQEETRLQQAQKEQEERERKFKEEQDEFRKKQEERQRLIDEENERIRKEYEVKEKELAARQWELERQEKEAIERARKEREEKEAAERKKQEEIDRKKRKKYEEEQALLFGEDSDRFAFLAQQLEVNFTTSQVWTHMKSDKGKEISQDVLGHINAALGLCKKYKSDRKAVPVTGENTD